MLLISPLLDNMRFVAPLVTDLSPLLFFVDKCLLEAALADFSICRDCHLPFQWTPTPRRPHHCSKCQAVVCDECAPENPLRSCAICCDVLSIQTSAVYTLGPNVCDFCYLIFKLENILFIIPSPGGVCNKNGHIGHRCFYSFK